jgi:hypothetical protein
MHAATLLARSFYNLHAITYFATMVIKRRIGIGGGGWRYPKLPAKKFKSLDRNLPSQSELRRRRPLQGDLDNFLNLNSKVWANTSHITMPSFTQILLLFVGLFFTTSAQFQFFEQMFGGGGQQQQQPQNVPSDSNWYRQNYEAGMYALIYC